MFIVRASVCPSRLAAYSEQAMEEMNKEYVRLLVLRRSLVRYF
jgi:hypothetical protein